MEILGNAQKYPKYICEKCNYITNKKSSYANHINSLRHQKNMDLEMKLCSKYANYACSICDKKYVNYSGL